jgi:protein toll
MRSFKIFFIFIASCSISAALIEVDCEIRKNPYYQDLFDGLNYFFDPGSQICDFKVNESESSSEINLDFPVDNQTEYLTFIYTNTSIPILPAELFQEFPDKYLTVGFYNLASIEIERDWFKHSENLSYLLFYQNRIPRLEGGKFVDLKNVYTLILQNNFIKEIDVDAFKGLDNLDMIVLTYNQLEFLHPDLFRNLPSLTRLNLDRNRLKQVTGLFENLENSTRIAMSYNRIGELEADAFTGLEKLSYLDISLTQLTSLHPDLFKDLESLKFLYLYDNFIKVFDEKVFGNLINLEELNFGGNQLEYLPEKLFENLTSLKLLFFDRNPIQALHENQFKKLVNLERFMVTEGLFESVPDGIFKNNGNLKWIRLQANISRMSNKIFSHLTKLDTIYLGHNYCVSLAIKEHNLNIFFTEELLIPCSCKLLSDGDSAIEFVGLLIFGILIIITFLIIFILKKAKLLDNLRARNGNS